MEMSDFLALLPIVISLAGFIYGFKANVHAKRQRRLLVTFDNKETFSGWGDDKDVAWCRLNITVENRSAEAYTFEAIRIQGDLQFGITASADPFTKSKLARSTSREMDEVIRPQSEQEFRVFFGFPRTSGGGAASFSVIASFKMISPLQGFDFLNLSRRRWYRYSFRQMYKDRNEIPIAR